MKKITKRIVFAAIGIFLGFVSSSAATRYLPGSSSDQTAAFQLLVTQSATGDIIVLQTGNHYLSGTVNVNKRITVRGENGAVVRKSGNVSCIDLNANYITIDNVYIDGGNRAEPGMRVFSSYNTIKNSTFRNCGVSGLMLHNSNFNTVTNCYAYYNYVVGISQFGSSDNTIANCQMYGNGGEGLTIDCNSHNGRFYGNNIYDNNWAHRGVGGIGLDQANGAWIYNNTINHNGSHGIRFQNNIASCDGVRVYDNRITNNEGCAISIRTTITHFGEWGNIVSGNPGGYICGPYLKNAEDMRGISDGAVDIELYPNPANSGLTIINAEEVTELMIVNSSGQKVLYKENKSGSVINLDVHTLAKGIYFLQLKQKNGNMLTRKFAKN
ncbi:MAG: right-handed parallel beta-helix repeat-containing protein [Bacteroidales bacterium]|nr:right-handed parallel beta-helix repeat-containing protein [Bacteroidales bacterium]